MLLIAPFCCGLSKSFISRCCLGWRLEVLCEQYRHSNSCGRLNSCCNRLSRCNRLNSSGSSCCKINSCRSSRCCRQNRRCNWRHSCRYSCRCSRCCRQNRSCNWRHSCGYSCRCCCHLSWKPWRCYPHSCRLCRCRCHSSCWGRQDWLCCSWNILTLLRVNNALSQRRKFVRNFQNFLGNRISSLIIKCV